MFALDYAQSFRFVGATLIAAAVHSAPAHAAPATVPQCLAAYEHSIEFSRGNRLLAARAELLVCASESCPEDVRRECSDGIATVNAALPTIVFEAKDAAGNDLSAVKVTVDGRVLVDRLEGTSLAVDPGLRSFVFETDGAAPVHKQFILVRAAKDRRERVTFADLGASHGVSAGEEAEVTQGSPPSTGQDASSNGRLQRILGVTAAGAGAAGVVVGVIFQFRRAGKLSARDALCPSGLDCAPGTQARIDALTEEARSASAVSAVSFIAGGALVATGLALVLTAPEAPSSSTATIAPILTPRFQGLAVSGHVW